MLMVENNCTSISIPYDQKYIAPKEIDSFVGLHSPSPPSTSPSLSRATPTHPKLQVLPEVTLGY